MSSPFDPNAAVTLLKSRLQPPPDMNEDEDYAVRTIIGEARGEGVKGWKAVAGVIRNRAAQSGYGLKDVVLAGANGPSPQFEPWGHPDIKNKLENLPTDDPTYREVAAATLPVLRGDEGDPTGGADHFYAPAAQAALGRSKPSWDNGTGTSIGNHLFLKLGYQHPGGNAPFDPKAAVRLLKQNLPTDNGATDAGPSADVASAAGTTPSGAPSTPDGKTMLAPGEALATDQAPATPPAQDDQAAIQADYDAWREQQKLPNEQSTVDQYNAMRKKIGDLEQGANELKVMGETMAKGGSIQAQQEQQAAFDKWLKDNNKPPTQASVDEFKQIQIAGDTKKTLDENPDYAAYLSAAGQKDSPETRAEYTKLMQGSADVANKANAGAAATAGASQRVQGSLAPPAQNLSAEAANRHNLAVQRTQAEIVAQRTRDAGLEPDPVTGLPKYIPASTAQDILAGTATTAQVNLRNKPQGANTGRYAAEQALRSVAGQYGFTDADIQAQLDSMAAKGTPFTSSYDSVDDSRLAKEFQADPKWDGSVGVQVTNGTINEMLRRRKGGVDPRGDINGARQFQSSDEQIDPDLQRQINFNNALYQGSYNPPDTSLQNPYLRATGDPLLDQAYNNVMLSPFVKGTDEEIQKEYERLKRINVASKDAGTDTGIGQTLQDILNAPGVGAALSGGVGSGTGGSVGGSVASTLGSGAVSGAISGAAKTADLAAGYYRTIGRFTPDGILMNAIADWMGKPLDERIERAANHARIIAGEAKGHGVIADLGEVGGNLLFDAPRLIGLTVLTGGNPVLAFGIDEALRSAGRGDNAIEVGKNLATGAIMGGVFHGIGQVGKWAGTIAARRLLTPEVVDALNSAESDAAFQNSTLMKAYRLSKTAERTEGNSAEAAVAQKRLNKILETNGLSKDNLDDYSQQVEKFLKERNTTLTGDIKELPDFTPGMSPANKALFEAAKRKAVAVKALTERGVSAGLVATAGFASGKIEGKSNKEAAKDAGLWLAMDLMMAGLHKPEGEPWTPEDIEAASGRIIRVPDDGTGPKPPGGGGGEPPSGGSPKPGTRDLLLVADPTGRQLHAVDVTGLVTPDAVDAQVLPKAETPATTAGFEPKLPPAPPEPTQLGPAPAQPEQRTPQRDVQDASALQPGDTFRFVMPGQKGNRTVEATIESRDGRRVTYTTTERPGEIQHDTIDSIAGALRDHPAPPLESPGITPVENGGTVTHPNPEIDGKRIVGTTADGRVVVPNEGNKSGVSIVKDHSEPASLLTDTPSEPAATPPPEADAIEVPEPKSLLTDRPKGAAAPAEDDEFLKSIIGEKGASNLDNAKFRLASLADAKALEKEGYPAETTWHTTGWMRGKDNEWRMEIPDIKVNSELTQALNPDTSSPQYSEFHLSDVVEGDTAKELFKAYPDLKNMKVVVDHGGDYVAYHQHSKNAIFLGDDAGWTGQSIDQIMGHEIQHAIQHREGFAEGASTAFYRSKAQQTALAEFNKIRAKYPDWTNGNHVFDARDPKQLKDARRLQKLLKIIQNPGAAQIAKELEQYHRTAGEVEARNVEGRMHMGEAQRKATPLTNTEDRSRKNQIILKGTDIVAGSESTPLTRLEAENKSTAPKIPAEKVFNHPVSHLSRPELAGVDALIERGEESTLPIESVAVKDIVPSQKNLTLPNLEKVGDIPGKADQREPIVLVKKDGLYHVVDGHHRIATAILGGQQSVKARVFDLDADDIAKSVNEPQKGGIFEPPVEPESDFQKLSRAEKEEVIKKSGEELTAPNGEPSNLPKSLYNEVRTPKFKKFFGDWENDPKNASRVVDENDEPMRVYHGTGHQTEGNILKTPAFFTEKSEDAEFYSHEKGDQPTVIPAFLNIRKPFWVGAFGDALDTQKQVEKDIIPMLKKLGIKYNYDPKRQHGWHFEFFDPRYPDYPYGNENYNDLVYLPEVRKYLQAKGYDGWQSWDTLLNDEVMAYIPFEPSQIKSAVGNSGEYDPTKDDFTKSVSEPAKHPTDDLYELPLDKEGNLPEIKVYRGAPTAEFGKGDFAATFVSANHKMAAQYGPVHEFTLAPQKVLDIDNPAVGKLIAEFDRQGGDPYADYDADEPDNLFLFPDKKWVEFLASKGYTASSIGPDLAVFDHNDLKASKSDDFMKSADGATPPRGAKSLLTDSPRKVADDQKYAVSTRQPKGHDAKTDLALIGLDAMPEPVRDKAVAMMRNYPGMKLSKRTPTAVEQAIEHMQQNLLWLHDSMPADMREQAMHWYDSGRQMAIEMAAKYKVSRAQAAGVIAAQSPQKDWFQNVSLADRILSTIHNHGDAKVDKPMLALARFNIARYEAKMESAKSDKARNDAGFALGSAQRAYATLKSINGKSLDEMSPVEAAAFIRAFDETYNDPSYAEYAPTGERTGISLTGKGEPARVAWSAYDTIAKGVSIARDGSRYNISSNLGNAHKVRSFYNNILLPNDPAGHVTIDTHAVAADLVRPLAGNDTEVMHVLGNAPSAIATGSRGLYGIHAEAYRRAAAERGLLPRQMQSITWEGIRGLFSPEFKREKGAKKEIDNVWDKGRDREEILRTIYDRAGGIETPSWYAPDSGSADKAGSASDAPKLPADRKVSAKARTRAGANAPADVPDDFLKSNTEPAQDVDELGFYSQAARTIAAKMPAKASADQVRGILSPANGVKADELKWLDIDSFLKDNPNPTKAEVLDYIRANNAQVQEVTKGIAGIDPADVEAWWNDEGGANKGVDIDSEKEGIPWSELNNEQRVMATARYHSELDPYTDSDRPNAQTKYEDYIIPGGKNYREVLLTQAPEETSPETLKETDEAYAKTREAFAKQDAVVDDLRGKHAAAIAKAVQPVLDKYGVLSYGNALANLKDAEGDAFRTDFRVTRDADPEVAKWDARLATEQAKLQELGSEDSATAAAYNKARNPEGYISSHWNEKNVLAHFRVTDRDIPDVGKTLLAEEDQADWAHDARQRGFIGDSEPLYAEANKIVDKLPIHKEEIEGAYRKITEKFYADYGYNSFSDYSEQGLKNQIVNHIVDEARTRQGFEGSPVPQHPFPKTWHEVAFRRQLRMAAEQGYDALAWAGGDVHVDRWGSERIDWREAPNSSAGHFQVRVKDGFPGVSGGRWKDLRDLGGITEAKLNEIGEENYKKELADKWGITPDQLEVVPSGRKFVVSAQEQYGGDAGGINIENEARSRGELLEQADRTVESERQLQKILDTTLTREHTTAEVKALAKKIWNRMLTEREGTHMPRAEGLRGFYDDIKPRYANKYLKKWGGRVEDMEMPYQDGGYGVTRIKEYKHEAGNEKYSTYRLEGREDSRATNATRNSLSKSDGEWIQIASYHDKGQATRAKAKYDAERQKTAPIHLVRITPEMRQSVMEGQPLYSRGGAISKATPTEDVLTNMSGGTLHPTGELEGNAHDMEMFRRVIEAYRQRNPGEESSFNGITIGNATIGRVVRFYNTQLRPAMQKNGWTDEHLQPLDDFMSKTGDLASMHSTHGIVWSDPTARNEEIFHRNERELGGVTEEAQNQLENHPLFVDPGELFTEHYGAESKRDQVSEIAAKLATGQAEKYGWTDRPHFAAEARSFLNIWADGVLANAADIINDIGYDEFVRQYEEIARHASNTETSNEGGGGEAQGTEGLRQGAEEPSQNASAPGEVTPPDTGNSPPRPIQGSPEAGVSKVGRSIAESAVADGLTDAFGDTAEYDKLTIADQSRRAVDLVNNDLDQARRIIAGKEKLPDGLHAEAVAIALENHALDNGDLELLREIAKSPWTAETSRHAQAMRLLRERRSASPVGAIKEIEDIKAKGSNADAAELKAAEKRYQDKLDELDRHIQNRAEEIATKLAKQEIDKVLGTPPPSPPIIEAAKKIIQKIDREADAARNRLKAKYGMAKSVVGSKPKVWDEEDAYHEYNDQLHEEFSNVIGEFRGADPGEKVQFPVVSKDMLAKVWNQFIDDGHVEDIATLNYIQKRIIRATARLEALTALGGHDVYDPNEEYELGLSKEEQDTMFDHWATDAKGQFALSDYGLPAVQKLLYPLMQEANPEKKLVLIDKILNVVHQRGDLADFFVEGGSKTVQALADGTLKPTNDFQKSVTETPEFKKWFGDSKVTEPDGAPMVVYHGTDKTFDRFEQRPGITRILFSRFETERSGFFFAEDADLAKEYGDHVLPMYLSLQNPADFTDNTTHWDKIENGLVGLGWNPDFFRHGQVWEWFDGEDGKRLVADLKKLGFDGAKIQETGAEDAGFSDAWVAFEPTQIKSADKNSGAFDPSEDSFLKSVAPNDLEDFAKVGASVIAREGLDPEAFADAMVKDFGEGIRSDVDEIYAAAKARVEGVAGRERAPRLKKARQKTDLLVRLKNKVDKAENADVTGIVTDLAKQFVAQGENTRGGLLDKVHAAIKQVLPNTTRREVMDMISGYGKYRQLSKDQIAVTLRDLKGQMQQVAKLQDMMAGQAPKKTGAERRSPSDEERNLIQQVEEKKKEGGYNVTDPATQLKTALAALKTRLRNSIADRQKEIATRQRIVKTRTALQYDAETIKLKAELAELKAQHEEIFGRPELTDEQRLDRWKKAAEKRLAKYNAKLQSGDYAVDPKKPRVTLDDAGQKIEAELESRKERLQGLRKIGGELSDEDKEEILQLSTAVDQAHKDLVEHPEYDPADEYGTPAVREQRMALGMAQLNLSLKVAALKEEARTGVRTKPEITADVIKKIWNAPMSVLTFGHGGVIPFTHGRSSATVPGEMKIFAKAAARSYSYTPYGRRDTATSLWKRDMATMIGHPQYKKWVKRGLDITVGEKPLAMGSAQWTGMAFDALKMMRFEMALKYAKDIGEMTEDQEKDLASRINHATGDIKIPAPIAKPLSWLAFAPKLRPAKYASAFVDPFRSKWAAKRVAKMIAINLGLLLTNYMVNKYLFGVDDQDNVNFNDPGSADWLRMKIADMTVPMAPTFEAARLPLRLGHAMVSPNEFDRWKFAKNEVVYGLNPMIGLLYGGMTGSDLATGKDLPFKGLGEYAFGDRHPSKQGKIGWPQYLGSHAAPMALEPVVEELATDGVNPEMGGPIVAAFASGLFGEHLSESHTRKVKR